MRIGQGLSPHYELRSPLAMALTSRFLYVDATRIAGGMPMLCCVIGGIVAGLLLRAACRVPLVGPLLEARRAVLVDPSDWRPGYREDGAR